VFSQFPTCDSDRINPKIRDNHQKMLKIVEETFLNSSHSGNMTKNITALYKVITRDLLPHQGKSLYRQTMRHRQYSPEERVRAQEWVYKKFEAQGVKIWDRILSSQAGDLSSTDFALHLSSTRDLEIVITALFDTFPPPQKIPEAIETFAKDYKKIVELESDPFKQGVWAHHHFIQIQPYEDSRFRCNTIP
jgi:hypothetical protein